MKSTVFGSGQWQIYLYANSGSEPAYISLYLCAEPTREERDRGAAAFPSTKEWTRTGTFRFTFELRMDGHLLKNMEAQDHAFDSASKNWGWASFIKRSEIIARLSHSSTDAFVIVCTITSAPPPPPDGRAPRKQLVPASLVDAYATLFDDPALSDVVFVFPTMQGGRRRRTRRLYASKRILASRSEYFRDAFSGAWAELTDDEEDEDDERGSDDGGGESDATADEDGLDDDPDLTGSANLSARASVVDGPGRPAPESIAAGDDDDDEAERAKTSTVPPSPIGTPKRVASVEADIFRSPLMQAPTSSKFAQAQAQTTAARRRRRGPVRTRVVVTDTSYRTFRSLVYFLYTDSIRFAPLASIYYDRREAASSQGEPWPWSSRAEWSRSVTASAGDAPSSSSSAAALSDAKAIYAVADKLMLPELKHRAFEHIKRSLSPAIVAYEAFGTFSARFPEVQAYEVSVFLQHWPAVRASPAIKNVFAMVAAGQGSWSGFQDVRRRSGDES